MENNKYYVSTADLIKLMNDVMNADKKSASEIIGIGKSSVSCPLKPSDSAPLC